MRTTLLLAICVAGLSTATIATSASALPAVTAPAVSAHDSLVTKTQGRYCRAWARECGRRWGWGGWRFQRCLRNHGC